MLAIGLTGGIGSGKTVVSDHFAKLGAAIIDTDVISPTLRRGNAYRDQHIDRGMGSHAGAWEPVNVSWTMVGGFASVC